MTSGNESTDNGNGFTRGAAGNALDVADLLQGGQATSLDNYLTFALQGSDTVITVHADGNLATTTQTITLQDVDLVTGYSNQELVQSLLIEPNLNTDI